MSIRAAVFAFLMALLPFGAFAQCLDKDTIDRALEMTKKGSDGVLFEVTDPVKIATGMAYIASKSGGLPIDTSHGPVTKIFYLIGTNRDYGVIVFMQGDVSCAFAEGSTETVKNAYSAAATGAMQGDPT